MRVGLKTSLIMQQESTVVAGRVAGVGLVLPGPGAAVRRDPGGDRGADARRRSSTTCAATRRATSRIVTLGPKALVPVGRMRWDQWDKYLSHRSHPLAGPHRPLRAATQPATSRANTSSDLLATAAATDSSWPSYWSCSIWRKRRWPGNVTGGRGSTRRPPRTWPRARCGWRRCASEASSRRCSWYSVPHSWPRSSGNSAGPPSQGTSTQPTSRPRRKVSTRRPTFG